jgi:GT2 family glycosyltransferase
MRVCAVVVTRNRRQLLQQCLAALSAQTRRPEHVMVVDNASTDGTPELLEQAFAEVESVVLSVNGGAAGGFHEGLRRAHAAAFDWMWLMDDDTIPAPDALQSLLGALATAPEPPLLLSSKVVWTDGRLHPMNVQGFERLRLDRIIAASERTLLPLRTATFVSLLVSGAAVETYGLPLQRYFLWSDDIEYTARILRHSPGYLVPASVAVHNTQTPHTAISASGERFYFHVRNTLYMLRGPAWTASEKPLLLVSLLVSIVAYLRWNHFALRALPVILRGARDGLRPGAPTPARP